MRYTTVQPPRPHFKAKQLNTRLEFLEDFIVEACSFVFYQCHDDTLTLVAKVKKPQIGYNAPIVGKHMNIGIDIIRIERIKKLLEDHQQVTHIFTAEEIVDDVETMAGRFAAKEAYFKARKEKIDWRDVIVTKDASGAPTLRCHEDVVSVSISHDGEYAIAAVIIN